MSEIAVSVPNEEDGLDELDALQTTIASQLSELSQAEQLPSGYKFKAPPFTPEEVDFRSANWLLRVLETQVWLCLDEALDLQKLEVSPEECAQKLFAQLSELTDPVQFVIVDGTVKPTVAGAQQLSDRLDIATALLSRFAENCEQLSRKEATKLWKEAWEEELAGAPHFTEPIKATAKTFPISQFTYYADQGQLNLNPSYQRGDVWPTSDAQKLIESIVRGIPLPSIIILKPRKAQKIEVVDGKQRLTSMLRFIGRHPEALRRVREADTKYPEAKLEDLFGKNYKKFRRAWKNATGESLTDKLETQYYFPFPLRGNSDALTGNLKPLAGKYYCEILHEKLDVGDQEEEVILLFDKTSSYQIPIIEYIEASPRQIQEVFNLYNKQGKHLNAEEIRNAVYHEVDLVKLLLVAAGDNKSVDELAGYLSPDAKSRLPEIKRALTDYKFGISRYKRTKVLSWLSAFLFSPSLVGDTLSVKSTAKHIDSLFASIRDTKGHPLSDTKRLTTYVLDLHRTILGHSSMDWPLKFKDNDTGAKWLELHLVASLTGSFLLSLFVEDVEAELELHESKIRDVASSVQRPKNPQNNTQWGFVAEFVLRMLDVLGYDPATVDAQMKSRYQLSCIPTLIAARKHYDGSET